MNLKVVNDENFMQGQKNADSYYIKGNSLKIKMHYRIIMRDVDIKRSIEYL